MELLVAMVGVGIAAAVGGCVGCAVGLAVGAKSMIEAVKKAFDETTPEVRIKETGAKL